MIFYLGLSFMSNNVSVPSNAPGSLRRAQTKEGRRILTLLDRKAGASPETRAGKGADDDPEGLAYEREGRPFFADGHADFNISHSGRVAAVVYVRGKAAEGTAPRLRAGCDVQWVDTRESRGGIVGRFYHDAEQRYVEAAADSPERSLRFFRLWVLKEAYLKMKGLPVSDIAKTPVFFPDGETPGFRAAEDAGALNFYLSEWGRRPDKYLLAVCLEEHGKAAGPPEVIWFSGERLPGGPWLSIPPVLHVP
jgi:hypothetical protein